MFRRVASLGLGLSTQRVMDNPAPATPSPREEAAPGASAPSACANAQQQEQQPQQQEQPQWREISTLLPHDQAADDVQSINSTSSALTQQSLVSARSGSNTLSAVSEAFTHVSLAQCSTYHGASGHITASDVPDGLDAHTSVQPSSREAEQQQQQHNFSDPSAQSCPDAAVVLNVGGTRYTTTRATLGAIEGSFLDALFSGRWGQVQRHNGEVFLDRDGEAFRHVLQYLRAVRTAGTPVALPESPAERTLLRAEADYYGLPGLAELCACYRGKSATTGHMPSAADGGSSGGGVLASCVHTARRLWAEKEVEWAASEQLLGLKDLLLGHVLVAPLQAQQVDITRALAQLEPGTCIEVSLQYYSFGDVRIDLEACICSTTAGRDTNPLHAIAEASTSLQAAAAATSSTAADGSSSIGSGSSRQGGWRPQSPTQQLQQLTEKLAAAAEKVAQAESAVAGGGRCATPYYSFSIRESLSSFVLTKRMPGGVGCDGVVEERQPAGFKHELARYSALHKLLVQQPQPAYTGLLWLLQREGFGGVHVATRHEQYFVGRNGFPGTKSVITLMLQ